MSGPRRRREDYFTNTVADAADYERWRAMDDDDLDDSPEPADYAECYADEDEPHDDDY